MENTCAWVKEESLRTAVRQMESGKRLQGFSEMEGLEKYECCSRGQMARMGNVNRMEAGIETVNTCFKGERAVYKM